MSGTISIDTDIFLEQLSNEDLIKELSERGMTIEEVIEQIINLTDLDIVKTSLLRQFLKTLLS